MATSSKRLLQLAVPLVKQHGFTREALSLCVFSLPTPHNEPLSDVAISTLFGEGDDARRSLITAWQDDAREQMKTWESVPTMKEVLKKRLECNEPVLSYLPEVCLSKDIFTNFLSSCQHEAFALLASPTSGIPPLDPLPGLRHAAMVADDACRITNDSARGVSSVLRYIMSTL